MFGFGGKNVTPPAQPRPANVIDADEKIFEEKLAAGGIVFVDFWASWCMPCRMLSPVYEEAARRHPDVSFLKVNTEEQGGLANAFGVRVIPTMAVLRDGVLVFQNAGMVPGNALDDLVQQVQALDMAEVKAAVEKSESEARP